MMRLTWARLCELCPAMNQHEVDARSFAANSDTRWYPAWLRTSSAFQRDTRQLAERDGWDVERVRDVAEAHLRGVFMVVWQARGEGSLNH